MYGASKGPLQK